LHSDLQPSFWKMRQCFCVFWPVQTTFRVTVYISEGVQAFTLLVVFLLYHDKMFTKMNNFLYTIIVNIWSRWCIIMIRNKWLLYIPTCINLYTLRIAWIYQIYRDKCKYYFALYFILYCILTYWLHGAESFLGN